MRMPIAYDVVHYVWLHCILLTLRSVEISASALPVATVRQVFTVLYGSTTYGGNLTVGTTPVRCRGSSVCALTMDCRYKGESLVR